MTTQKPPYTITEKAASLLAKIVETVMHLEYKTSFKTNIGLHRENRARTIHSSLAIEGNSLSLSEVRDLIEGKLVAGTQEEIKEVKNAYQAYDKIMSFNPYSINDFLLAHSFMTQGLIKESGKFRSGDVGVFDGGRVIHLGARPKFVPQLVNDLFTWAKTSKLHPIIKSAIIHYEIETIHPFEDGNGRMGRLWQTLILAKWKSIFAWIPMESLLYENRPQYYQAIETSREANDSGAFIEFTLSRIYDILYHQVENQDEHQDKHQDEHQDEFSDATVTLLKTLAKGALSRREIFVAIGIKGDSRAFKRHITPLLLCGFVEMTVPDKPNSKLQKYRLTDKGRLALRQAMGERLEKAQN